MDIGEPPIPRQGSDRRRRDAAAGAAADGAGLLSAGAARASQPDRATLRMGVRRAAGFFLAGGGCGGAFSFHPAAGEVPASRLRERGPLLPARGPEPGRVRAAAGLAPCAPAPPPPPPGPP